MARCGGAMGSWWACVALGLSACGSSKAASGTGMDAAVIDAHSDASADAVANDSGDGADISPDVTATDAVDAGSDSAAIDSAIDVPPTDTGPKFGCGDGICSSPETLVSCPADCKKPLCGDGFCQSPESGDTCALDCAPAAVGELACIKKLCPAVVSACSQDATCADLLGTALECASSANGNADQIAFCGQNLANNTKSKGLSDAACGFASCAGQANGAICGDGVCQPSESSASCSYDCIGIAAKCGDGICTGGETSTSCPADCATAAVCGNGKCESGEDSSNCPSDCPFVAVCGDGACDTSENASNCAIDCDAALKGKADCLRASCGGEFDLCTADPACVTAITTELQCLANCATGDILCTVTCTASTGNPTASQLATCGAASCP